MRRTRFTTPPQNANVGVLVRFPSIFYQNTGSRTFYCYWTFLPMTHDGSVITNLPENFFFHLREEK